MAWQDEMTELVRAMTVDFATPPRSSDDSIERVLVCAAQLVASELTFSQSFKVNISDREITPDPTDTSTRDDPFVNLVCMRAAAIIDQGVVRAESGIVIRDNGSMVDLHYKLQAALALVKEGWQKRYDDEKWAYQNNQLDGQLCGKSVISPFREIALAYNWGESSGRDRR